MGGSMKRLSSLAGLCALTLLCGCFQFDGESTIAWAPSGGRVAFLSGGKPWVYSLDAGALSPLPGEGRYLSLAWSPREEWLAVSTASYVEAFHEEDGVFSSSQTFSTETPSPDMSGVVMWHPDGRRLLYSEFSGETATTNEVELDSGVVRHIGAGIGLYGPGGDWMLWSAPVSIGRRSDRVLFDRQNHEGESLSLDGGMAALEKGFFDMLVGLSDNSPLPLCAPREDPERPITDVLCLDASGALVKRATLPARGRVFPDRGRTLFALVEEPGGQEPRLGVYDEAGKLRADGKAFLKRIAETATDQEKEDKTVHASRLAWSPDGNWIAWVVNGRLCLWNWRNDEVRVHRVPADAPAAP